jgi:hypothetical protein
MSYFNNNNERRMIRWHAKPKDELLFDALTFLYS